MKSMFLFSLCMAITLCLYGCGDGPKPPTPPDDGGKAGAVVTPPDDGGKAGAVVTPPDDPAAEIRAELNNTEWEIELSLQGSKKKTNDVLTFIGRKFSSQELASQGYPASNYTLRVKGTKAEWETMQTHEEGKGTVFWRGELREGKMRGMMVVKLEKQKDHVSSFVSKSSRKIQPKK